MTTILIAHVGAEPDPAVTVQSTATTTTTAGPTQPSTAPSTGPTLVIPTTSTDAVTDPQAAAVGGGDNNNNDAVIVGVTIPIFALIAVAVVVAAFIR